MRRSKPSRDKYPESIPSSFSSVNATENGVAGLTRFDSEEDEDEELFSGRDRGCCCILCCRKGFLSIFKPASREVHMDKIQRSGGYMIDLPCFKFGKNIKMHRWDSEGRVSPHMQAHLFAKSQNNILFIMRRGSCLYKTIWCSARSVLCCYRCIFCARFVHNVNEGRKTSNTKKKRRHSELREKGCCGYTELDHVD